MVKVQTNSQGKVYTAANGKALVAQEDIGITREVSQQGVYQMPTTSFTFSLPSNATDVGTNSLQYAFQGCTGLTSVDLSALTTVSGGNAFRDAFDYCSNLASVDLSALTTVSGDNAFRDAFDYCSNLASVDLSALTTVSGESAFESVFRNYSRLTSINLSSLTTVSGNYAFRGAFEDCPLTSIDLSSLTTVGYESFEYAFRQCPSLTTVSFPSLVNLGGMCFGLAFQGCSSLQHIYFPALTSNSLLNVHDPFDYMLRDCSNVTVHFPISTRSTIESMTSIMNGMDGTNTTIAFDLNACLTTFTLTPNTNNQIHVNSELVTGNSIYVEKSTTANYNIYNANYGLYVNTYVVPSTDTSTITLDLNNITYNTVTLNVGVSGLTTIATVNGVNYNFTETSSGVYELIIYNGASSNVNVGYTVLGGASYMDETGTISLGQTNISETITLTPATSISFVRPNLSENGTMGGNAFAVTASPNQYEAYYAVDSDEYSAWRGNDFEGPMEFVFYNPNALNVTQLITKSDDDNIPETVTIKASNDNQNWTTIGAYQNTSMLSEFTMNLSNSGFYKYYKLEFTTNNYPDMYLNDLGITATYKVPTA